MRDTESPGPRDRAHSEFLATAAHELRSPVANIYGFSELLLQRPPDGPKQHELLRVIHDQSAQMSRLINELLDLTRIEAMAGRDFKLERTDAGTLVRNTVACFLVPTRRAPVELHIPPALPAIMVDRDKTQQALTNVLSNAYKYSHEGAVQITVSHEPGDLLLAIVVRDEGIGMTPAIRERIFERFFRAPQTGEIPGTGLGMPLVKEIVEAQQGLVRIASEPGCWTEVTLLLPLAATA
jgi:signal transduction histidine kinase